MRYDQLHGITIRNNDLMPEVKALLEEASVKHCKSNNLTFIKKYAIINSFKGITSCNRFSSQDILDRDNRFIFQLKTDCDSAISNSSLDSGAK